MELKNQSCGCKTVCVFSIILIFERNYDVLKSKSLCILLNKNINFNRNETESKMENPTPVLERKTLCFSSYKNRKLKVKLLWVGAHEIKKRAFFVRFILSEGNSFYICVSSQCIVYWIQFQNIYTFTYKKILLHTFFCLFSKSWKVFSVSLKRVSSDSPSDEEVSSFKS